MLEKVVKVILKENEQELNIKVCENVDCKYPDTKIYIEENLKEKT